MIDRIVATVNGHIILLSDWEDSLRYEAFSSGRPLDRMTAEDRKSALDHLIDQELLREQLKDSDIVHPSPEEVAQRVVEIRKQYAEAETELGWHRLLDSYRLSARIETRLRLFTEKHGKLLCKATGYGHWPRRQFASCPNDEVMMHNTT